MKLRVFCDEYKKNYVGNEYDSRESEKVAITNCGKQLRNIQMSYLDPTTKQRVTTKPDTVYRKMVDLVALLPEDGSNWPFCLPWIFYEALTLNIRHDMESHGYTPAMPASMPTNTSQIQSLTICRDEARKSHRKMLELDRQVERVLDHTGSPKRPSNVLYEANDSTNLIYDDDIDPNEQQVAPTFTYSQNSRAEQTIQNELRKRQRLENFPNGFEQSFTEKNGEKFPNHPSGSGDHSRFPVGFNGCFGCGRTDHRFSDWKTRLNQQGRETFYFDLHCHKPEIYFKNIDKQTQPTGHYGPSNNHPGYTPSSTGRGRDATEPAWMTNRNANNSSQYSRAGDNSRKTFVIKMKSFNFRDGSVRRMPIDSKNELPHIRFPIGMNENDASICCLYDTVTALNIGELS